MQTNAMTGESVVTRLLRLDPGVFDTLSPEATSSAGKLACMANPRRERVRKDPERSRMDTSEGN